MVINWVEVRPGDEEGTTLYIVGAAVEERFQRYNRPPGNPTVDEMVEAGLDPNETNPCWARLKVYPNWTRKADELTVEFLHRPGYYEFDYGLKAIPSLLEAVCEIEGLSLEEAQAKVFGRVIDPIQPPEDFRC